MLRGSSVRVNLAARYMPFYDKRTELGVTPGRAGAEGGLILRLT